MNRPACVLDRGELITVLTLAACDGPTVPSDSPNLVVRLTDDHTKVVAEVNLFFTSVTAKPVGAPVETLLDLGLTTNPQDLLALQDTTVTLASGVVLPGMYDFLMINLDAAKSGRVLTGGDAVPLQIPSEKIKILGGFDVGDGGTTTITLDFDVERSLVLLGNGDWLLTPVITKNVAGP